MDRDWETGIPSTIIAGVDIIAGNDDEDLEPMVKGLKLVEALKDLSELVQDLNGAVFSITDSLKSVYGILGTHTHPVLKAVALPSQEAAAEAATQGANLTLIASDLMQHQKNMVSQSRSASLILIINLCYCMGYKTNFLPKAKLNSFPRQPYFFGAA